MTARWRATAENPTATAANATQSADSGNDANNWSILVKFATAPEWQQQRDRPATGCAARQSLSWKSEEPESGREQEICSRLWVILRLPAQHSQHRSC